MVLENKEKTLKKVTDSDIPHGEDFETVQVRARLIRQFYVWWMSVHPMTAERKRTGARPILRLASRMRVGVYFRIEGRTGEDLALLPYPSGVSLTSQRQRYGLF